MAAGLVILGGLPASGKTTIARALARETGAVHVRVDTIEQAIVDSGLAANPLGPVGYRVAYAVAADQLDLGLCVVADTVNPAEETREAWRRLASDRQLPAVRVEILCSDRVAHRERATSRDTGIATLVQPTWTEITGREYAVWSPDLRLDTAHLSPVDGVAAIIEAAPWLADRRSLT